MFLDAPDLCEFQESTEGVIARAGYFDCLHRNRSRVQRGSEVQGFILVPRLHLGCAFTRKASASSDLNPRFEANLAIILENEHFYRELQIFNTVLVLNPER